MESIIFVYKKGNKVKCLELSEAKDTGLGLLEIGFKHVATIRASTFIQSLLNDISNAENELKDIIK